jgi:hypothetical protein
MACLDSTNALFWDLNICATAHSRAYCGGLWPCSQSRLGTDALLLITIILDGNTVYWDAVGTMASMRRGKLPFVAAEADRHSLLLGILYFTC